ncbi:LTA synthase family protein [Planococcus lenghuensis]|nr:LTA synthase family protein [Planococcus lenghuensis]
MIVLPVLTLIVSEVIVRQVTAMSFEEWRVNYSERFVLNMLLLLALFNLLFILPRKWFMLTSLMLSGVLIAFAFANKMKMELRHAPIAIGDFALLGELGGLENPIGFNIGMFFGIGLAFIAVVFVIFFVIPRYKENWIIKCTAFFISATFLFVVWTDYPYSPMQKAKFENTWWQLEVGMTRNGLFGNFALLAKNTQIEPPSGYSRNAVQEISDTYIPEPGTASEKPNVIFLMSESFVDPYEFGEEHFAADPVPNFRKLYKDSLHGDMYSPEFGGGTANVEFEALTGFSRQFLPPNSIAYQLYIKDPLPSVAYEFREAGYDTTAIHSFYGWYYQRQDVYKMLGFNRFISGEFMDLDYPNGSGHGFPNDKHITNSILAAMDNSEERDFIHAVSTEAHMPYTPLEDSEFLKTDTLQKETRQYLNRFTEKMHSVDEELGRLIDEIEKREEPAIVVFFGDHYPSFDNNEQVFGAAGADIANDMTGNYEDFLATHKLPYFIWSSERDEPQELDVTPNQFGPIVLDMAEVEGNTVTAILNEMREQGNSVIPYNQWQAEMGGLTEEMKDLQLLQHDLLHGKRYVEEVSLTLMEVPSAAYHLGLYSAIKVQEIYETANAFKILVKGAPKYAELRNGDNESLPSEWMLSDNGLSIFTISKEEIEPRTELHFAVFNSRNSILRKSEPFILVETE